MEKFFIKLQKQYQFSTKFLKKLQESFHKVEPYWQKINEITFINQLKILEAFQKIKPLIFI